MPRELLARVSATFLIDRSLGRKYVVEALTKAGVKAEALDVHFPQNAPDVEWLEQAGRRGMVVLSKDAAIRRHAFERSMLRQANVRAFILTRQDLTGTEMAQLFVDALPGMLSRLARHPAPFVFSISRGGAFTRVD